MEPPAYRTLEPLSETQLTRIGHGPDEHGKMQVVLLTENPRSTIGMEPKAARDMCERVTKLLKLKAFVRERNHGRMQVVLLPENPRLTISMEPQAARGMCECILELLNLPAFVRERN